MEYILPNENVQVEITHPHKVFWPGEGITKGDVADYYNAVYPHIIKYIIDRPQSLYRTPDGIASKGFFHKDAGLQAPEWVKSIQIHSESTDKEIHYIICNNRHTLMYLVNLGCIEINPWNSRLQALDRPDYLVIDIDPSELNTYDQVIEVALAIKEQLDRVRAVAFPKTSGATGMHIYVPLGAKYSYSQAQEFAHQVALRVHDQLPAITTLERHLAQRAGNLVYLDYLQNSRGKTMACAYSLRPRPGATVSAPLEWPEVKPGLRPSEFTIHNIIERIAGKGDLFAGVLSKGFNIDKALKNMK